MGEKWLERTMASNYIDSGIVVFSGVAMFLLSMKIEEAFREESEGSEEIPDCGEVILEALGEALA